MTVQPITIPGDNPITLAGNRRQLSEDQARELTTEIQRTSVRLWVLVTEAHDRRAYAALGYATWDDYCRAELRMSPSRSYQLLDTGHVMKELAVAGVDLTAIPVPTTRVVARVKNRLPEVRRTIRRVVSAGEDVDQALRELARQAPTVKGTVVSSEEEETVVRRVGRPPVLVVCPLCVGEGKVSRSLSAKTLAWLRRNEKAAS